MNKTYLLKIANILREIDSTACIEKAKSLEKASNQTNNLHLRSLELNLSHILAIANILKQEKNNPNCSITSISFSYNRLLGNEGVIAIAESLPNSINEIGLVACGIGDRGGEVLLKNMEKMSNLKMLCIEQNNFSEQLKRSFLSFANASQFFIML